MKYKLIRKYKPLLKYLGKISFLLNKNHSQIFTFVKSNRSQIDVKSIYGK